MAGRHGYDHSLNETAESLDNLILTQRCSQIIQAYRCKTIKGRRDVLNSAEVASCFFRRQYVIDCGEVIKLSLYGVSGNCMCDLYLSIDIK